MKCLSCSAQQPGDANFCEFCGTLLKVPFTTQKITAMASAPDSDNDTDVNCELFAEYNGTLPVPITKFRLNAFYIDDEAKVEHSIKSGVSLAAHDEDIESGDSINVSAKAYFRIPKGGQIENISIKPQLILYPVKWHGPISHKLSDKLISETVSMDKDGLRVIAWSLFPAYINDNDASYNLRVHLKNESISAISMIAVRAKVLSRKNKELHVSTSWIETLGPQEDTIEDFDLGVSEDARTRNGAKFEIQFGECIRPIIANLDKPQIELLPPEEPSDDDDDSNHAPADDDRNDNTEEDSDGEEVEASSSRKAKFTFSNVINFELDADQAKAVISIFGLQSAAQLEKCDLKGFRDDDTEESYEAAEKIIFPHISAKVFFHNFGNANAIFADPEQVNFTGDGVDGNQVVSCKLIHCCFKEGTNVGGKRLEIGVAAEVILDVVAGVDVENPDDCDDDDLQDQFRECRNMFNFWIDGFEYDDDDVLDHKWQAHFVSELNVFIAFETWKEIRAGQLPRKALFRIIGGDDFDDVITETLGDHPTAVASLLPAGEWVLGGDVLKGLVTEARNYGAKASCKWQGQKFKLDTKVLLLPKASSDADIGSDVFIDPMELVSHVGQKAARDIANIYDAAVGVQSQLDQLVYQTTPDERCLWVYTDSWKGTFAKASAYWDGETAPLITAIYFVTSDILPRGRELVDGKGKTCEIHYAQLKYLGYLAAFVIGEKVIRPSLFDDRDSGIDRIVIDYSDCPTVCFRSL